jgi:hypothetical protein
MSEEKNKDGWCRLFKKWWTNIVERIDITSTEKAECRDMLSEEGNITEERGKLLSREGGRIERECYL